MDRPSAVDPRLLEILVCPACYAPGPLRVVGSGLACPACGRVYAVRPGGFPAMVVEPETPPESA